MSSSRRAFVRASLCLFLLTPILPTAEAIETRLKTELVMLIVTVTDETGRLVTNLTHNDFAVFDNKELQEIVFFTREDTPANVGILIDISKPVSARDRKWFSSVCQSVLNFKKEGNGLSEYFLIGIGSRPRLVTDWTSDDNALVEGLSALAFIEPTEQSAVNDACSLALDKFKRCDNMKSVILSIGDGQDNASISTYSRLRESMQRSPTLLYSVCPAESDNSPAIDSRESLKELSALSGGRAYFPSSENEMGAAFKRIASELRQQYMLAYYPPDGPRDGSWHGVKVVVNQRTEDRRRFSVRTQAGYYFTKEPR